MRNNICKKLLLLFACSTLHNSLIGQNPARTATVLGIGIGEMKVQAKEAALRDAIEQAFGAFISTKTEVVNNQIVKDEINSIANGNILSYSVTSESFINNTKWSSTVKAVISLDNIITHIQSKGMSISFQAGILALNAQQRILNELGELRILENMHKVVSDLSKNAFDLEISASEPLSFDGTNEKWRIPIEVHVKINSNFSVICEYIQSTLTSISLRKEDIPLFKKNNLRYYVVNILKNSKRAKNYDHYYFRNYKSVAEIENLITSFKDYLTNFEIDDGISIREFKSFDCEITDNFRIAAYLKFNRYIVCPSLFFNAGLKMYLPHLNINGIYGGNVIEMAGDVPATSTAEFEVCDCMGNIFSNEEGLILQFNKLKDLSDVALKIKFEDVKNIAELKNTKAYNIRMKK